MDGDVDLPKVRVPTYLYCPTYNTLPWKPYLGPTHIIDFGTCPYSDFGLGIRDSHFSKSKVPITLADFQVTQHTGRYIAW